MVPRSPHRLKFEHFKWKPKMRLLKDDVLVPKRDELLFHAFVIGSGVSFSAKWKRWHFARTFSFLCATSQAMAFTLVGCSVWQRKHLLVTLSRPWTVFKCPLRLFGVISFFGQSGHSSFSPIPWALVMWNRNWILILTDIEHGVFFCGFYLTRSFASRWTDEYLRTSQKEVMNYLSF